MDQFQDANLLSTHMRRRLLYILFIEIANGFECLAMCYHLILWLYYIWNLNQMLTYAYFKRLDYFSTECMSLISLILFSVAHCIFFVFFSFETRISWNLTKFNAILWVCNWSYQYRFHDLKSINHKMFILAFYFCFWWVDS